MANSRDANKRLKGFGIPIEVCVKYERMAGVKLGEEPTKEQRNKIADTMVTALTVYSANVILTSEDYKAIAEEVAKNEKH